MTHSFQPWPKIARLNRDIVITEKIDGTNAAIGIERIPDDLIQRLHHDEIKVGDLYRPNTTAVVLEGDNVTEGTFGHWVYAQSRNRVITPGKSTDNSGFAGWVAEHAEDLVFMLGEGLHFGEWWGRGIQRGYDEVGKRFSLFNTQRYVDVDTIFDDDTFMTTVPVLYQGPFGEFHINACLDALRVQGSFAAPGFRRPEGIVVYHTASGVPFKVTLEGDEAPKGVTGRG